MCVQITLCLSIFKEAKSCLEHWMGIKIAQVKMCVFYGGYYVSSLVRLESERDVSAWRAGRTGMNTTTAANEAAESAG